MADVPVYMVANFHIHDAEKYRVYEKGFFPLLKKYGFPRWLLDVISTQFRGRIGRSWARG